MKRAPLKLKKEILKIIKKEKEISLRALDIKLSTNSKTLISQVKELHFFKAVEIIKYEKNEKNGRPYTSVKLTKFGSSLI